MHRNVMLVDTGCPEQASVFLEGVEVFDSRVEVVNCDLATRAVKDVQSHGREGAVVYLAVLPDVQALHEAQVNPEGQVAFHASHFVRVSAHPCDVRKADVPDEVGDGRWVFRIRGILIRVALVVEMTELGEAARNRLWVGATGGPRGRQETRAEDQARGPGRSAQELAPGHGHRDVRVATMTMQYPQATVQRNESRVSKLPRCEVHGSSPFMCFPGFSDTQH
jgi:hypothetical protein